MHVACACGGAAMAEKARGSPGGPGARRLRPTCTSAHRIYDIKRACKVPVVAGWECRRTPHTAHLSPLTHFSSLATRATNSRALIPLAGVRRGGTWTCPRCRRPTCRKWSTTRTDAMMMTTTGGAAGSAVWALAMWRVTARGAASCSSEVGDLARVGVAGWQGGSHVGCGRRVWGMCAQAAVGRGLG